MSIINNFKQYLNKRTNREQEKTDTVVFNISAKNSESFKDSEAQIVSSIKEALTKENVILNKEKELKSKIEVRNNIVYLNIELFNADKVKDVISPRKLANILKENIVITQIKE